MKKRLATDLYTILSIFAGLILLLSLFQNNGIVGISICIVCAFMLYGIGWYIKYIMTGKKDSILINLLSKIKRQNPTLKTSLSDIVNLPIVDLITRTEPFNFAAKQFKLTNDDNLNSIIFSGIISYQLFTYFELVKSRFGNGISEMTEENMWLKLDSLCQQATPTMGLLGQKHKELISLVRERYYLEPSKVKVAVFKVAIPKEYDIATSFLFYIEASPYYFLDCIRNGDKPPEFKDDIDWKFAKLLKIARKDIIEKYAPIINNS